MEGHEHDFWDKENRLGLGLAEGTRDLVFEKLGYGPKDGADQRADAPDVAQKLGINTRVELPLKINRASVIKPRAGGADFQIVGVKDAIGNHESAGARAGAAVAQAGRDAVEDGREQAEGGDFPDEPILQVNVARALPRAPIGRVGAVDDQSAIEHAFKIVSVRREIGHNPLELSVGGDQIEPISGAVLGAEIELGGAAGVSAVKIRADVAQGQVLAFPIDMPGDVLEVEAQPVKWATVEVEMQVGIAFAGDGNDAINARGGRPAEDIRFDRGIDFWPNRAGDNPWIGGAEAIGQVDFLVGVIDRQTRGAQQLRADPGVGLGQLQKAIGVLQGSLKTVRGLPSKSEIGQCDLRFDAAA